MEELFVYALLYSEGLVEWTVFESALDRLFMEHPDNREYLSLEEMPPKEAVLHTLALMNQGGFEVRRFGAQLMKALQPVYKSIPLEVFAKKLYQLWSKLPPHIDRREPFEDFSWADNSLSYGDTDTCRQICERVLRYYE